MSGGTFNYRNMFIDDIADEIVEMILANNDASLDEYGDVRGRFFSDATIEKFEQVVSDLRRCAKRVKAIDYLVAYDTDEESFAEEWEEE